MATRFAVLYFWQMVQKDGYLLEFHTNIECHLWMTYSYSKYKTKETWIKRRGLDMHCNVRYYFSSPHYLEQEEAGLTLIHSFNVQTWYRAKHLYWFLRGLSDPYKTISTGPIMHLPLDHSRRHRTRYQKGYGNSGMAVSFNRPRAMQFKILEDGGADGVEIYCRGWNQPAWLTVAIYDSTEPIKSPRKELVKVTLRPMPAKRTFPNKGELYFPLPHAKLTKFGEYFVVVIGDSTKPNTDVFWWSRYPLPGSMPGMSSWYGEWMGDHWHWHIHTVNVLQYGLWQRLPFYQPGAPGTAQIYPKD